MKYRMIALDIDCTLLTSARKLPKEHIDAMRAAVAAGAHVMIATGRPYRAASWVLQTAGIEGLLLSVGGSLIHRFPSEELLVEFCLDSSFVRDFMDYCTQKGWFFHCIHGSEFNYTRVCEESILTDHYFGYPGRVRTLEEMAGMTFHKGNVVAQGRTHEIAKILQERFDGRAIIQVADDIVIDVTPAGVDKGRSIALAAERLGVDISEVLAVGDADSDISMLRAAGLGVCMANGTPNTLAAADYIAPSNDEFGVREVIERFILEK